MAIRTAEALFNFPRLYRLKFAVTGAVVAITKPLLFRNHITFREILAKRIAPGERVCEVGCGDGENYCYLLSDVGRIDFTGADLNPNMIAHCRERYPEAQWICSNLAEIMAAQSFHTCIISNVLHHLNARRDITTLLQTASRLARRILLFEPLQSDSPLVYALKRLYFAATDGGNIYLRLEEFHQLFDEVGVHVDWEWASEPFHHFYSCQISRH